MIKLLIFITLSLLQSTLTQISSDTLYDQSKAIIADLDSIVTPEGIQENFLLDIGAVNQWVFTRGKSKKNPVILMVHGGPASPLAPLAWTFQRPIEEYLTVVNYDQRGREKPITIMILFNLINPFISINTWKTASRSRS